VAEVAAIRDVADDRKPPGIGGQGSARRGHHDPYDGAFIDLCDAAVSASDVEIELIGGKFANGENGFELGAGRGREIGAH
jgi:hypothetical protein